MRHTAFALAALLAGLSVAHPAYAEDTAKQFLAKIDGRNQEEATFFKAIIGAIAIGIQWSEHSAVRRGAKPAICIPEKLAVTTEQDVDILRKAVEEDTTLGDVPAGLALLFAYQATFPCKSTVR